MALASWLVVLVFDESALAELSADWLAELEPPLTEPPAIVTGTLALTAFWSADADELDCWLVLALADGLRLTGAAAARAAA